jgi:hypothetical protein
MIVRYFVYVGKGQIRGEALHLTLAARFEGFDNNSHSDEGFQALQKLTFVRWMLFILGTLQPSSVVQYQTVGPPSTSNVQNGTEEIQKLHFSEPSSGPAASLDQSCIFHFSSGLFTAWSIPESTWMVCSRAVRRAFGAITDAVGYGGK